MRSVAGACPHSGVMHPVYCRIAPVLDLKSSYETSKFSKPSVERPLKMFDYMNFDGSIPLRNANSTLTDTILVGFDILYRLHGICLILNE